MYGMVNNAVRDMVLAKFGTERWREIHQRAGAPADFEKMQAYDDAITYRLVQSASEVLQLPANEVMHAFGIYWVTETAEQGYGPLLALWGNTFVEFVSNLNALHERVAESFKSLEPPSFNIKRLKEGLVEVHYRSQRPGLSPFVQGLLVGLGERFDTIVKVQQTETRDSGADHDVFLVEYTERRRDSPRQ